MNHKVDTLFLIDFHVFLKQISKITTYYIVINNLDLRHFCRGFRSQSWSSGASFMYSLLEGVKLHSHKDWKYEENSLAQVRESADQHL